MLADFGARPAHRCRPARQDAAGWLLALLKILSRGESPRVPMAPPPPPPRPRATTLSVTPDMERLDALGATVQLAGEVRDQNGQVMTSVTVEWSSADSSVAEVDATGLVTATGNGGTEITAIPGSGSGRAAITVAQSPASVTITPPADTVMVGIRCGCQLRRSMRTGARCRTRRSRGVRVM
ncbi:Ig-like domain-containing protein [Candidatus Palauibacter sp.]|uniref:Ig-like domain-containing protein n=1 Tax=Candidatus Palauibacter sp. TaxID=3101350 RepID=UPI003B01EF89